MIVLLLNTKHHRRPWSWRDTCIGIVSRTSHRIESGIEQRSRQLQNSIRLGVSPLEVLQTAANILSGSHTDNTDAYRFIDCWCSKANPACVFLDSKAQNFLNHQELADIELRLDPKFYLKITVDALLSNRLNSILPAAFLWQSTSEHARMDATERNLISCS